GLDAGTYVETVTVTGGNNITASFSVSFTVNPAAIAAFENPASVLAGRAGEFTDDEKTAYGDAEKVAATLLLEYPKVTAKYAGGSVEVPVTAWAEGTDPYNAFNPGEYAFVATLGTIEVKPGNYSIPGSLTAEVIVRVNDIVHGVTLDASGHAFTGASYGYTPESKTVTITNIGVSNGGTGTLALTLSGDNSGAFTVSPGALSIAKDGTAEITVSPAPGLVPGTDGAAITYTAALTVSGSADAENGDLKEKTYTLSFTVSGAHITGFAALEDINGGVAGYGTPPYAAAAAVISALNSTYTGGVTANAENGRTVTVPVTSWTDTDTFDPGKAGSYTFTAALNTLPDYFTNPHGCTATVEVVVSEPVHAAPPKINTNPAEIEEGFVGVEYTLTISAEPRGDMGTLTYQWYTGTEAEYNSSAAPDFNSGRAITGASSASYDVPTDAPGTLYYWCVVTNTDGAATGNKISARRSQIARVTLRYAWLTVKNGVITGGDYDGETWGEYKAGDTVTIKADSAPSGQTFAGWRENTGYGVALPAASEGAITIPAGDAEIEALYKAVVYFPLSDYNGGNDGKDSGEDGEEEDGGEDSAESGVPGEGGERVNHNPFTDVSEDDWFYSDVEFAYERGLFTGTGEDTFSPGMPMTRSMLVTVLYRLAGGGEWVNDSGVFADVESGLWYSESVAWAASNGIVLGVGENLFAPDAEITRQEIVTVLYRYVEWAASNGVHPELEAIAGIAGAVPFDDSDVIADWAREAVAWAHGNGIVQGRPGNVFDPKGRATRAEVAAILHRLLTLVEDGGEYAEGEAEPEV
ncbi:MAG: S-layer homology domain-containing protein, partial [Oscillospiraceae bacterium]|nr:S-layer homology domain-containing protein [Oscillospiraceae bacterium]